MKSSGCDSPIKEFERFTDAGQMKAIFQQQLPGFSQGNLLITGCRILRTRYKTYLKGRSRNKSFFTACYQLQVTDQRNQRNGMQILYARACLEGRSLEEFQRARSLPLAVPRFGQALVHLPELDLLVWAFPNDPGLPHLPEAIEPPRVIRHLPYNHLPAGLNEPADIANLEVDVVHYYPEQRCTSRYQLRGRSTAWPHISTLFGKTFKDETGQEVYRRMAYLWQKSQAEPGGFTMARPLAYNETIKTVWQESLPGLPLVSVIDRTNYQRLLTGVAAGLVILHQSHFSSPTKITLNDHLAEIQKKSVKLIQAFPHLKESLLSLVRHLENSTPDSTTTPVKLIHGDFHIRQLLVHQGRIVFFDFDEFALGDPVQDLANFIVDLHFQGFDPDFVSLMAAALCQAYTSQGEGNRSLDHLNWYLSFQFITKAYRYLSYRQQEPELKAEIERAITLAQREIFFKTILTI